MELNVSARQAKGAPKTPINHKTIYTQRKYSQTPDAPPYSGRPVYHKMYVCVYVYIYISVYIYTYIGDWGADTNRKIVLFRSCALAQLYVSSEWISKMIPDPFSLFPFHLGGISSLFPWEIRCSFSLEINEVKWIQVRSSESKWVQVRSSESKWNQMSPSEIKWDQVSPSEPKWDQVSPSEFKWEPLSPSEIKWFQVSPSETKWVQV